MKAKISRWAPFLLVYPASVKISRYTHIWQEQVLMHCQLLVQIKTKMAEMQEAVKKPEVQEEIQQMTSMLQNKEVMAKMQELQACS